ncbi:hypothetical protein HYS48_01790, partial [Candidatus Woesearchaeota archaeon]|nr:hypothetical protein [Candidatus Woesearchaeota archaeon]
MPLEEIVVEKETQEDFGIVLENEKYSVEGQRDVPAGLAQERLVETIAEHENVRERFKEERESWIAEGIRQIEEVREDLQDLSIIVPLELIEPTEHRIALYLEGRITEQQLLFRKRRQHKKIRGSKRQYEGGYADITEEQDLTPYRTEFGLLLFPPNIWRGMVDLLEENCTHGEILEQEARAMEEGYRKNPKIYQDVGSPFEQGDVSEKASTSDSLDYSHPEAREHQAAFVQDGVSKGWYRNVEEMYA